jgi:hypothetical protein
MLTGELNMNTPRGLLSFLSAAAVVGFASCSGRMPSQPLVGAVPTTGPVSDSVLQASLGRWSDAHVVSYRYRFRWNCYCTQDYVRMVDITVTRGVVVSVTDAQTGVPLSDQAAANYRTIDGLFDFVRGAVDGSVASVNGAFDPTLGYPSLVSVDYAANTADDEKGFQIFSLMPSPLPLQ